MLSQQHKLIIENYYRHIRELYIQLELIQLHSSNDEMKTEVINELGILHNKLLVSHLMADKSLLAITGLQGVGKTTLINRLYDLPDGIFPENSGRGERLPMFIKEKDIDEIETYVYRLHHDEEKGLTVVPEAVNPKQINKISLNPIANRDLWVECVVPKRHLNDESDVIVLLPGFEKDQNDISQLLLEHILYISQSSVLALRKDTYAREETQRMMSKVKTIYKDAKPVVAITFGDVNPNDNTSFKHLIMNDFEIRELEEDRVVITGQKPNFKEDWQANIKDAIEKYCYANSNQETLVNQLIQSLAKNMDVVLLKINKMMDNELKQRKLAQTPMGDRHIILQNFENEYTRVLTDLKDQIQGALQLRVEPARDRLREYLATNTTWHKEMKTKFFGQKPEELYTLEEKIQEIWEQPFQDITIIDDNQGKPERIFNTANGEISQIVTNYLTSYGKDVFDSIDAQEQPAFPSPQKQVSKDDKKAAFIQTITAKKKDPIIPNNDMMPKNEPTLPLERIDAFFTTKDEMPIRLKKNDFKTLAVIGTMLIHETYAAEAGYKKAYVHLSPNLLDQDKLDINVMEKIQHLSKNAPIVLKSIPIILGVDGLIDGKLDLLTHASTALATIGITLSSAQLAGIIGVGFIASFAGKAIQESMQKANERQLKLAQAGERVFQEMPERQAEAFTNALKRIFERMSDQLMYKHLELSGSYDSIGELEHINYTARKIGKISQDIKRSHYEQSLLI